MGWIISIVLAVLVSGSLYLRVFPLSKQKRQREGDASLADFLYAISAAIFYADLEEEERERVEGCIEPTKPP